MEVLSWPSRAREKYRVARLNVDRALRRVCDWVERDRKTLEGTPRVLVATYLDDCLRLVDQVEEAGGERRWVEEARRQVSFLRASLGLPQVVRGADEEDGALPRGLLGVQPRTEREQGLLRRVKQHAAAKRRSMVMRKEKKDRHKQEEESSQDRKLERAISQWRSERLAMQDTSHMRREMREDMTEEIRKMVGVLKENTLELSRILSKDNKVLDASEDVVQENLRKTERETRRMKEHLAQSRGATCGSCAIMAVASFLFFFVFAVIRQFPAR